jgi:DNA polymerase III subunit epsilon
MKELYLDTETTDFDEKKGSIHQIAWIYLVDGKVVSKKNMKFQPRPGCEINQAALDICKLTKEELLNREMPYYMAIAEFIKFVNKEVFTDPVEKMFFYAYNSKFDERFIRGAMDDLKEFLKEKKNKASANFWYDKFFHYPAIDVAVIAGLALKTIRHQLPNFKLYTVVNTLKTLGYIKETKETDFHDAMYDVAMTIMVGRACEKLLKEYD